ncbi:enoyl-CoA hydratase/isomerase family protein [Metabacillus arenae]|uniref:3-hydroxyisobutyryl-CoA hydrolase n=1 Tax=Metabacillus arenae TaxID=2771434 RepID=A0A926NML0_9BACI|nr:enoyl-CoA hydratase/isomerase family protein [Metabacillus arenae]MBD1382703.1 enoyl-CoA hydratase/isomerase family protein [Metabacillus arenae]
MLVTQESVVTEAQNGVGWIKLNRPRALNSLNVEMVTAVYKQLKEWKQDDRIALVCIYGEGEKGLCAGGDMRTLYDLKENGVEAYAEQFFSTEYPMDYEIHHYPKPVVVYMNGIVMGGGVGLSVGASHRIVTETTKWAMPEMNIGFFPDVGASYFLNQMPGNIGRYLALTADVLKASDVLYAGAADYYLESENWPKLRQAMMAKRWSPDSAKQEIDQLLKQLSSSAPSSSLSSEQEKIDQHFQFEIMEDIVSSLRTAAENGGGWAEKTVNTLLSKSPTSLKVTLRQIQEGKEKQLYECFKMEMNVAMNFMKCHDFYEGVRSVLVDKDRNPKWNPAVLEGVSEEQIASFFHYSWNNEQNPLTTLTGNKAYS